VLRPPADRLERDPQLALDRGDLVLAYSRVAQGEGACGDDGLEDLGVYVRTNPDGIDGWSKPKRFGEVGDRLQAFRAVDGVLHATVTDANGRAYYESGSVDRMTRVRIPDAVSTSLRVGDDQRARIAYSTGQAIRYGRVDGGKVQSTEVDRSDTSYLLEPALVLAPGDVPTIMWTQNIDSGGGCASPEPAADDGTYIATNAGGSWDAARVSAAIGPTSLTLDPSTGRWHAVVVDTNGVGFRYLTGRSVDDATERKLPGDGVISATVRLDPSNGDPAVFALRWEEGIDLVPLP
jgi:hypothetical protein